VEYTKRLEKLGIIAIVQAICKFRIYWDFVDDFKDLWCVNYAGLEVWALEYQSCREDRVLYEVLVFFKVRTMKLPMSSSEVKVARVSRSMSAEPTKSRIEERYKPS
jgi:hypothetical protein